MNPVIVRDVEIGVGIPKICVPVTGSTEEEILKAAAAIKDSGADIVEWRADWYEDIADFQRAQETLTALRSALGDMPLLFTFRTLQEGGERELPPDIYIALNKMAVQSGTADLVDVELSAGEQAVKTVIGEARANGVKTVVSSHDFQKTPPREEIVSRLRRMQELGADIPKIAVMPQSKKDVLTLLAATEEMASHYADRPIITMSMSGAGSISRLCGEVFGSAVTFGAVGRASAPGQIDAQELAAGLTLIHRSL